MWRRLLLLCHWHLDLYHHLSQWKSIPERWCSLAAAASWDFAHYTQLQIQEGPRGCLCHCTTPETFWKVKQFEQSSLFPGLERGSNNLLLSCFGAKTLKKLWSLNWTTICKINAQLEHYIHWSHRGRKQMNNPRNKPHEATFSKMWRNPGMEP